MVGTINVSLLITHTQLYVEYVRRIPLHTHIIFTRRLRLHLGLQKNLACITVPDDNTLEYLWKQRGERYIGWG
jgi:hypothetical protein